MSASTLEIESYVIDQIRCPECSLTCLQKNIYRHMTQMHQWAPEDCKALINAIRTEKKNRESKTSFACSYCRVLFRSVKHLLQHKKICAQQPHLISNEDQDLDFVEDDVIVDGEEEGGYPLGPEPQDEKPSTSSGSNFGLLVPPHRLNTRQVPAHHLLQDRELERSIKFLPTAPPLGTAIKYTPTLAASRHRGTHLKCPECNLSVESLEEFLNHCKEKHESENRKFIVERRLFDTKNEFKKWFDQRQEDTCTSLTKRTGHAGETLYRCHRVGKYRSVAKSRKSNPRKIDQTCTAYLKVTLDDDGATWATGCFTHIGHDLDYKLLWLTESQENYVRELIDMDWTSDQIFYFIRDEYKDYESKLKYVTKNDIRNITVRYNREKEKMEFLNERKVEPIESNEQMIQQENVEEVEQKVISADDVTGDDAEDVTEEYQDLDEIKAKVARMAEGVLLDEKTEETEEQNPKESLEDFHVEPSNDVLVDAKEDIVEEEEDEYINVVDDDSMPELEKVEDN